MTALSSGSSIPNKNQRNFIEYVKYEHLIAGLSGGITSTLILHPLDLLKIRFEINNVSKYNIKYKGIIDGFITIFKEEGIKGLYRGVYTNTVGTGAAWGSYFYFYTAIKTWKQNGNTDTILTPGEHLVAASEAGFLSLVLTNPIWVCKTRMCTQNSINTPHNPYKGILDTLIRLYRTEGIKGWYRGFVAGIFGVSHGAIQFMVYEEMKNGYNSHRDTPITTKLGVMEYLTFAAVSKCFAVVVTYPYQVVRARLQNQFYSYDGNLNCIRETWKFEGWKGFYKGLGTNLVRVIPATMITFVTYEYVSHFLISMRSSSSI